MTTPIPIKKSQTISVIFVSASKLLFLIQPFPLLILSAGCTYGFNRNGTAPYDFYLFELRL